MQGKEANANDLQCALHMWAFTCMLQSQAGHLHCNHSGMCAHCSLSASGHFSNSMESSASARDGMAREKGWPERRELSALPDFRFHSASAGCLGKGGCCPVQNLTGALQAMGGSNAYAWFQHPGSTLCC